MTLVGPFQVGIFCDSPQPHAVLMYHINSSIEKLSGICSSIPFCPVFYMGSGIIKKKMNTLLFPSPQRRGSQPDSPGSEDIPALELEALCLLIREAHLGWQRAENK